MLNILLKEFKHTIRNVKSLLLRILFPLVLMLILGTVFGSSFGSNEASFDEDVVIGFTYDKETPLYNGFNSFLNDLKEYRITAVESSGVQSGIESVKNGEYPCYINISNQTMDIYMEKTSSFEVQYLDCVLNGFRQNYNLVSALRVHKLETGVDFTKNKNWVKITTIKSTSSIRAIDYFGITMLTLIIMYSISSVIYSITMEYIDGTLNRIRQMPVNIYRFFIGKLIGNISITILQASLIILISKTFMGVSYGKNFGYVVLILLSQIIMCSSLGIAIGVLSKKHHIAQSIFSVLIPVIVFLGGGYFPLERIGSKFLIDISIISPIKWINDAIFGVVYLDNLDTLPIAITINLWVAVFVLIASAYKLKHMKEV